jgi:very-short-patch-repair endonuclease
MGFLLILAVFCVLFLAAYSYVPEQSGRYKQTKPLSEVEQVLYWRLVSALPECIILCQVTFSRFMRPDFVGRVNFGRYVAQQNKISQKSIDFLVCLKDFTVVAAVELDDATHVTTADQARDELLQMAGIQVVRMHVRDLPSIERVRELFTTEELAQRSE